MGLRNGRGGTLKIANVKDADGAVALPAPAAWAAATSYVVGDVVTIGAKLAGCKATHTSVAGGLTGVGAGTQSAFWEEVDSGQVYTLGNWTLNITEQSTQETTTMVVLNEDVTLSSSRTLTGSATMDVFFSAKAAWNKGLKVGHSVDVTLYEHGKGAGQPQTTFKGRVTGDNRSFSTTPLSRSYTVEIADGAVVDGTQA